MSEAELLQAVKAAALSLRIRCCYTGSPVSGFPDLVFVTSRGVLFRELENQDSAPSRQTLDCLTDLHVAGCDVAIWRPAAWPDQVFAELESIRPL